MAKTTTPTPQSGGPLARARERAASAGGRGGSGSDAVKRRGTVNPTSFWRESAAELKKVTWPTRQDALNLTTAVIGMTVAMAIFLGLIDAGLDKLVTKLLGG